jgi:hypothetical protein
MRYTSRQILDLSSEFRLAMRIEKKIRKGLTNTSTEA